MSDDYESIESIEDEFEPNEEDELLPSEYSLTSYGIDFDVSGIVRRFEKGLINIPFFQRDYVWPLTKASKFIESILIGLPIPGIFLYKEDDSSKLMVIDGQQRIKSLVGFVNGEFQKSRFVLKNVHKDFEGLTYKALSPDLKAKFDDTLIHATIVKPDDPKKKNLESIFLVFERLNTGGLNLSPQEIRACISHGGFQNFLEELSKDEMYKNIIGKNVKRRKDEEIALRLFALSFSSDNYSGNMKKYLNAFMEDNKELKNYSIDDLRKHFIQTFTQMNEALGADYFKPSGGPVNLAILDSIFVALFKIVQSGLTISSQDIVNACSELQKSDKYIKTVSTGKTHHTESVKERIRMSYEVFTKYAK